MTPKPETILSTAPGTTQEVQATPAPEENSSDTTSTRPSQPAPNHANSRSLASEKKTVFFWYAAVFSDISTVYTIKNTGTKQQDQDLDVHNNDKLDDCVLIDEDKIADTLTTMHSSLCTSEFKKYREYRKCPTGTLQEVNARLAALMKEDEQARLKSRNGNSRRRHRSNDDTEQDSPESEYHVPHISASISDSEDTSTNGRDYHRLLKRKRKFVRIMKKLFQLFLPLRYTSEMITKYWGAVDMILQVLALGFVTTKRRILTFLAESRCLLAMA